MENRRPLKSRNITQFHDFARYLSSKNITPNQISQSSLVFAFLAFVAFLFSLKASWMLILAAIFIQLRLLANLLDGLVAVEMENKTSTGGFWNEFPDRPADILILTGMGVAAGATSIGLIAALMALMTAYTRALGAQLTGEDDFEGIMAKPQRMFLATIGALLGLFSPILMTFTLLGIIVGSATTIIMRAETILNHLKTNQGEEVETE